MSLLNRAEANLTTLEKGQIVPTCGGPRQIRKGKIYLAARKSSLESMLGVQRRAPVPSLIDVSQSRWLTGLPAHLVIDLRSGHFASFPTEPQYRILGTKVTRTMKVK